MSDKVSVPVHFIRAQRIYVRLDDVVAYIREVAATEETDTRERLLKVANNFCELVMLGPPTPRESS